jgi:hypothetical protein
MRKTLYRCPFLACSLIFGLIGTVGYAEAHAQSVSAGSENSLMFGLHYGVPLKWSVALAAPLPGGGGDGKPFVAAEPGIGGWRASLGYARMTSNLGSGYVARATFVRTNNKPWRATPQSSFAGAEFQFMPLFGLGARLGGFFRIGRRGEQRGLLTADVSLML